MIPFGANSKLEWQFTQSRMILSDAAVILFNLTLLSWFDKNKSSNLIMLPHVEEIKPSDWRVWLPLPKSQQSWIQSQHPQWNWGAADEAVLNRKNPPEETKTNFIFYSVLRIRIRDPVPFWPLDPGSGIGFSRILDPKSIFWVKSSIILWKLAHNFFFSI